MATQGETVSGSKAEQLGRCLLRRPESPHALTATWRDSCPHVKECSSREECESLLDGIGATRAANGSPPIDRGAVRERARQAREAERSPGAKARLEAVSSQLSRLADEVQALLVALPSRSQAQGMAAALGHTVGLAGQLARETLKVLP